MNNQINNQINNQVNNQTSEDKIKIVNENIKNLIEKINEAEYICWKNNHIRINEQFSYKEDCQTSFLINKKTDKNLLNKYNNELLFLNLNDKSIIDKLELKKFNKLTKLKCSLNEITEILGLSDDIIDLLTSYSTLIILNSI